MSYEHLPRDCDGRIIWPDAHSRSKFDFQLELGAEREALVARMFGCARLAKVEVKSEQHQWERTGNIAVEYMDGSRPSGIAITEADYWVHELCRDGEPLVYLVFPTERLRQLARQHWHRRKRGGDEGRMRLIPVPLSDILR